MKSNKIVVIFLIKFFVTYALLFLLYSFYLSQTQEKEEYFSCSPITNTVAKQTKGVLNILGYKAKIEQHETEVSVKLGVNDKFVARIIEGCNSINIIILFIAFIVAFASKFSITLLFIVIGSLIIYIVNIFRIAVIAIALYEYPQFEGFLHGILFPLIIYGIVFLLWFIWIRKFSPIKR